jgi:CBS-domain-containing membrane protein
MTEYQVRKLVVLDANKRLVGMVGLEVLLKHQN